MELAEKFKEYALDKDTDVLAWFHELKKKEQLSLKKEILHVFNLINNDKKTRHQTEKDGLTLIARLKICAMYVYSFNQYLMNFGQTPHYYWLEKYYVTFRPKWLNQLLEDSFWTRADYPIIYELNEIEALPNQIIVQSVISIFGMVKMKYSNFLPSEKYIKVYPKFVTEHLWLIFSEPSNIQDADYYEEWTKTFVDLCENKLVKKQRVLEECLLTAGRNFNKNNTGWFFKLFSALEPTLAELKALESSLLLALNCPFSKAQNETLKHLKTLAKEGQINPTTFIEASSSTLSSDVKSVVTSTIAIIETIAKQAHKAIRTEQDSTQNKELLQTCCDTLCQGFMLKDEKIQTRIAKFIVKYGDTSDTNLSENISSYAPELFSSVQTQLADFLPEVNDNQMDDIALTIAERIREDNVIILPQTFDDKIYFLNQAFDNNDPYHFDVYLNIIVSLFNELTVENVHRLLPVIQKLNRNGVDWRTSRAEQAMGLQFIYFISRLLKRFHGSDFYHQIQKDTKLNEGYFKFELAGSVDSIDFFTEVKKLESFSKKTYTSERNRYFLKPLYLDLVQYVDSQLDKPKDKQLPMLSLPTHAPCFIEFNCFIERLINHLAHDATLKATNTFDFQLALSRVVYSTVDAHQFFKSAQFLKIQEKNKEIANLLHYLLEENSLSVNNCTTLPLWLTAVYVKQQNSDFQNLITHYQKDLAHLQLSVDWQVHGGSEWKEIKYALTPSVKNEFKYKKIDTFQQYIVEIISPYIESYQIAIYEKLFCLTPNNMHLAYVCIVCGTFGYDPLKEKFANTLLNLQFELWQKHTTDAGYIYFAMMLLHSKNTVKQLAGELWLKTIQEQNVDTVRLGTFMGKLLHDDFAPLKRFTDLLTQQLMNVSGVYNKALITLISHMIAHMNDTPIKGTKKLLELYLELLTVMKTELTDLENAEKIQEKLAVWAETKSLKALIKKLN